MSAWQNFNIIYSVLLLILVGSAFICYKIPLKQTMKMLLVWVFIFAIGFVLVYGFENFFNASDSDDGPNADDKAVPGDTYVDGELIYYTITLSGQHERYGNNLT